MWVVHRLERPQAAPPNGSAHGATFEMLSVGFRHHGKLYADLLLRHCVAGTLIVMFLNSTSPNSSP